MASIRFSRRRPEVYYFDNEESPCTIETSKDPRFSVNTYPKGILRKSFVSARAKDDYDDEIRSLISFESPSTNNLSSSLSSSRFINGMLAVPFEDSDETAIDDEDGDGDGGGSLDDIPLAVRLSSESKSINDRGKRSLRSVVGVTYPNRRVVFVRTDTCDIPKTSNVRFVRRRSLPSDEKLAQMLMKI